MLRLNKLAPALNYIGLVSSIKWSALAHLKSQPRGQNFQDQKPVERSSPHHTRIDKIPKIHLT